jgi:hypothetical protein
MAQSPGRRHLPEDVVTADQRRHDAAERAILGTMSHSHIAAMRTSAGRELWREFCSRAWTEAGQLGLVEYDRREGRPEWTGSRPGRGPRRPAALPPTVAELFLDGRTVHEDGLGPVECSVCFYEASRGIAYHLPACPLCGARWQWMAHLDPVERAVEARAWLAANRPSLVPGHDAYHLTGGMASAFDLWEEGERRPHAVRYARALEAAGKPDAGSRKGGGSSR